MSYAVQELSAAEWQAWTATNPAAHLLQRAAWGELKGAFGWQPQRVVVRDVAGICAGAQILWRTQFGLKVAYVPRGPVWSPDERANTILLDALVQLARRQRAIFLRLEPNALAQPSWDAQHSLLLLAQFEPAVSMQPQASIHLDVTPGVDVLFSHFSKGHRADVRRSERVGVQVRVGTSAADLDHFYAIMQATAARADFAIHSRDYYWRAWQLFGGADVDSAARLLLAEHEAEVVAAFIVFAAGAEAQYMYSGSTKAGLDTAANHALQWAAIQWARARGAQIYDFWGIPSAFADLDDVQEPLERERLKAAAQATGMAGVYRFKKGWGGHIVRYVPAYDRVFLRPAYWLWQRRRGE